ncbi:hypothetical protein SO802_020084 [Lithocarpus litseifolius]|uniref:Exocyst subunit Exo70 family protein n=1 Tax=Lithocarpus litseifolius TaxID=425828 RepID=A0AAW2CCK3_9ROSI
MTDINTAQHIVQSLNTPVRADEDNEDNLIDPEAVDELREIETRMVRQVYRERSMSLVAGSFFPSAISEAGSGSWDWNETNPDSPLNISSIFPSTMSETDDSSPEFSRSNSDSIMSIFLPATSPIDSPENYEIIVRSRSIPSYSIMSIFPPAMSEIDSPDNYEIIFRNPSIPSYYHFFPPDMSDTDSYGSSTPNHQLSIPSWTFLELENAMQNESSVKGMQSGGIHPLTQYVMNYVQLILDYSDSMNLLEIGEDDDSDDHLKLTAVVRRVLVLITSLLSNLEEKSKLYKDPSAGLEIIKKQRSRFDPIRAACIEFQQVEPKEHASTALKTFSINRWNSELGQLDVIGKQNKPNGLQRELEADSQLMG